MGLCRVRLELDTIPLLSRGAWDGCFLVVGNVQKLLPLVKLASFSRCMFEFISVVVPLSPLLAVSCRLLLSIVAHISARYHRLSGSCARVYIYISIHIYVYIYESVYIYTYIYIYIDICLYI